MEKLPVFEKLEVEEVACPVCGPVGYSVWMSEGGPTRYVKCAGCGTVYASPRTTRAVRTAWLDSTFSLCDYTMQNSASRRPALRMEANILSARKPGGRLLDIGCSTGDLFEFFNPGRWQMFGVELSPSAARHAAMSYNAHVHAGTLQTACFPEQFFDLVTMIDMFYYLDDPRDDLREVARVMRPDGLLAIEIPGQAYQFMRSRGLINWLVDHRWTRLQSFSSYLMWYSPTSLEKLLRQMGFDILGWEVIAQPEQNDGLREKLSKTYYGFMRRVIKRSPRLLTWAPKYLCLARPRS